MRHDEYRALPGVNWSTLSAMRTSPLHYRHRLEQPREDTPGMRFGRALHCAVLEPDDFPLEWTVYDGRRAGTAWTEFATVNAAKGILTVEDYERVLDARDAVLAHKAARRLLRHGRTEVTLRWVDQATKLRCKGRLDHLRGGSLTDLKSTQDIEARTFGRLGTKYGYIEQLAFYRRGLAANGITPGPTQIVAVEALPPHDVAVFEFDEETLWAGDENVGELLAKVKQYHRWRCPPGRYPEPLRFEVSPWYYTELEDATSIGVSFGGTP